MAHLINRLQIEFNCSDEEQAFHLRQNFALTYQDQIIHAVDNICSRYVEDGDWITIDRLVIDLGEFTPLGFEDNFAGIFQQRFEKKFVEKLSGLTPAEKKDSRQTSMAELFQYFLQTGVLPWWASNTEVNLDEIVMDLIRNQKSIVSAFLYSYQFVPAVWHRAALQLNTETKASLIALVPELNNTRGLLYGWLKEIILSILHAGKEAETLNMSWLENLVIDKAPFIFKHLDNKPVLWSLMEVEIEGKLPDSLLVKESMLKQKALILNKGQTEIDKQSDGGHPDQKINAANDQQDFFDNIKSDILPEKYFVTHSGLVLLAPFLQTFFRNLGLLREEEWKNIEAEFQAIHLLRFLTTGLQQAPEFQLALEKVVCGLPIDMPIPLDIKLADKDLQEANDLLESVISHWKSLKNTSVNGLRDAFLKRDGLLIRKDEGWLLQVERKTLDVLIDTIPWGYSTLKFPWNPYLIFVEW